MNTSECFQSLISYLADLRILLSFQELKDGTASVLQADSSAILKLDCLMGKCEREYCRMLTSGERLPPEQLAALRYQILESPFMCRAYCKPLGYPGDYELMRMVHDDPLTGKSALGIFLNYYVLNTSLAYAMRSRTRYVAQLLGRHINNMRPAAGVMSIACGPAFEVEYAVEAHPEVAQKLSLTLVDKEHKALDFCLQNLIGCQSRHGITFPISTICERADEFFAADPVICPSGQYSLTYSTGLFDYLDDASARLVLKYLLSLLAPGGELIIANLSLDNHRYRALMEIGLEWYLVYRSHSEMFRLADGLPRIQRLSVDEICGGLVKFLRIQV